MPELSMVPVVPAESEVFEVAKMFEVPKISELSKVPETGAGAGAGALAEVPEVLCNGVSCV